MSSQHINLETLSDDDVISFRSGEYTSRIGFMLNKFRKRFVKHRRSLHFHNIIVNTNDEINASNAFNQHPWFEDGEACELLTVGEKSWKKGRFRVRLSLEFIPDEEPQPDNELNHFRKSIESSMQTDEPSGEIQAVTKLGGQEEPSWPPNEPMN